MTAPSAPGGMAHLIEGLGNLVWAVLPVGSCAIGATWTQACPVSPASWKRQPWGASYNDSYEE